MSGKTHQTHTTHATHATHASHATGLRHAEAEEHKVANAARKVDSTIREVEVLSSGNPRRIRRYFARKWAYKLFGKLMGKTINRL
jgi:hypothetical protein